MRYTTTPIDGVVILRPSVSKDERGSFTEIYGVGSESIMPHIRQISRSESNCDVIRGLHLQYGMGKIMRVTSGVALVHNVDMRPDSPTYLMTTTVLLEADVPTMVYAPWWCARGFCALINGTVMEYLHDAQYDPSLTYTVPWDSELLGLVWPTKKPILSEKDKNAQFSFLEWETTYRTLTDRP